MIAGVVVLGVLLLGAVVLVVLRTSALSTARTRVTELESQVSSLETDLAAANHRADVADARATKAAAEAAAAGKRAETAERAAADASTRADDAEGRAMAATARAEAAEATITALPADGVWALDVRRVGRVWRDRVSVTLDGASPVAGAPDPAEAAVRVLADASREEAGVVVDVTWNVDAPPAGAARVRLVRVAEELIAAAWATDGADLDVVATPEAYELRLRTDPPSHAPIDLAEALHACGAHLASDGGAIVVRLPRATPASEP